jgi:hypothetical protein
MEHANENETNEEQDRQDEAVESDREEPLFRIKSVAPYVNEPVVQQNCIR